MTYPTSASVYVPSFEVDPALAISIPIRNADGKLDLTALSEFNEKINAACHEAATKAVVKRYVVISDVSESGL